MSPELKFRVGEAEKLKWCNISAYDQFRNFGYYWDKSMDLASKRDLLNIKLRGVNLIGVNN